MRFIAYFCSTTKLLERWQKGGTPGNFAQQLHTHEHGERARRSHSTVIWTADCWLTPGPVSRTTANNRSLKKLLNFEQQNSRTGERQNGRAQPSMTPPITLSTARRRARGLGTRQPSVASLGFYLFSQCNNGVNISFTSVYNLSLLYTYISLLYTCSNLLTVNMIALNTVSPGTGE